MDLHALMPMGLTLALAVLMLAVIISDAVRYTIPNSINLAILALYGLAIVGLPMDFGNVGWAFAAATLVLVVGIGSFALGLMGGGDAKLLFALTLWTGWGIATVNFLFLTAVTGGVLVVVVLLLRALVAPQWVKAFPARPLPRILTRKQPVPYGLAIASAFLWLLWGGGIPALN